MNLFQVIVSALNLRSPQHLNQPQQQQRLNQPPPQLRQQSPQKQELKTTISTTSSFFR